MSKKNEKLAQQMSDKTPETDAEYLADLDHISQTAKKAIHKRLASIFTETASQKIPMYGFIALVRPILFGSDKAPRYLKIDDSKTYPDSFTWVDTANEATLFKDEKTPMELFEALFALPGRKFMGRIMPALPLAGAFRWENSEPQVKECMAEILPIVILPPVIGGAFRVEIKEDTVV